MLPSAAAWMRTRFFVVLVMSARRSRAVEGEGEVPRAFQVQRAQVPYNVIRTIQPVRGSKKHIRS